MELYYFCTYFDKHYLPRGVSLYQSLEKHCREFHIFILCFDNDCFDQLKTLSFPNATPISLKEIESRDEKLIATKRDRTLLEYYYTCGPSLPLFILNNHPEIDLITYIDADIYFYSDPKPLFDELEGHSVGLTAHHFPEFRKSEKNGIYNVGWLTFRRDANGLGCLQWWRDRCIEWCHERHENGKYADQKYLDEWPIRFKGVHVLNNRGANVAPWNVGDYVIAEKDGCVLVDNYSLVFFHFHGFKQISRNVYNTNLGLTFRFPSKILKNRVYLPYIQELISHSPKGNSTQSIRKKRLRPQWIQRIRTILRTGIGLIFRQYVLVIRGRVY